MRKLLCCAPSGRQDDDIIEYLKNYMQHSQVTLPKATTPVGSGGIKDP